MYDKDQYDYDILNKQIVKYILFEKESMCRYGNMNPEQVKKEIFKLASLKYDCCTYDDRPQKTAKLREILGSAEQMNILDIGLLQSTVSKIAISHFCTVTLKFINGVTIKQTIERGQKS